jgi:hypothetical protein
MQTTTRREFLGDAAGERLVGIQHRARFDAPFGWYDAYAAGVPADEPGGRTS